MDKKYILDRLSQIDKNKLSWNLIVMCYNV